MFCSFFGSITSPYFASLCIVICTFSIQLKQRFKKQNSLFSSKFKRLLISECIMLKSFAPSEGFNRNIIMLIVLV